jgi:dynactin complex subunit
MGLWAGIQLETPTGKNNGRVEDVWYFDCEENHGVFVDHRALELVKRLIQLRP